MTAIVRPILLDQLDRRADARAVNADQVLAIATSMIDVGQISPIRVRPLEGDRFEIVAGVHRVEACRSLGLAEVDALIVDSGELFAELAMIDENLCRAELGPADRARQTARRKAIYEELHPETVHGGDRSASRQVGDLNRFSADTAQATGASERTVQRDAARGERISDAALGAVAGTDLDTGVFLDELKDLEPDEQLDRVRHRLNGERAIAARRVEPADSLDYFPTPPWATRALMELVLPDVPVRNPARPDALGNPFRFWEPACGEGHMAGVLCEYSDDVVATDIAGYGSAEGSPPGWSGRHDFLDAAYLGPQPPADWIITNPPFGELSLAFALKALELAQVGVALFVRQQWLEGVTRYGELFSKHPPALVAQFAERVNLKKGEWDPDGDTLTAYCWVVWVKGGRMLNGDTRLMWIPPGQRDALTRPDDIERFTAHPVRVPRGQGNHPEIPDSSNSAHSPTGAAPASGDAGEANRPSEMEQPASPANTILPTSGKRSDDESQAAEPGDGDGSVVGAALAGEVAESASPALTFTDARPILEARYATEHGQTLADELGLSLGTLRSWAFKLGLTSKERARANGRAHADQLIRHGVAS